MPCRVASSQDNRIFPELSVKQHLELYVSLKGLDAAEGAVATEDIIRGVGPSFPTRVPLSTLLYGEKGN